MPTRARRLATILGVVAIWIMLAAAGGDRRIKQEIFVVDADTHAFIIGAVVTVQYTLSGDATVYTQQAETAFPHGNVQFTVPATATELHVEVAADGYETAGCCVSLRERGRVGGKGYWIELPSAASVQAR
jgi:hypothetical protein